MYAVCLGWDWVVPEYARGREWEGAGSGSLVEGQLYQ